MTTIGRHYRVREVMQLTGLKRTFVYEEIRKGKLEVIRLGKRIVLIPESSLVQYFRKHRRGGDGDGEAGEW